jgi:geranylgeranyl reductase family protein
MYDVIIVGGGPHGCISGSILAKKGFDVLNIEKKNHPKWKPCGEAISTNGINILKKNNLFKPIKNNLCRINSISINILDNQIIKNNYSDTVAYTLDRSRFDFDLFKYSQSMGVKTHENEHVISIKNNKKFFQIKSLKNEYRGSSVIGADGVFSIVGKKLFRPWYNQEIIPCRVSRYKIPKKQYSSSLTMEFYFIKGGYCWIFPKIYENSIILNIGIGKFYTMNSSIDKFFINFLRKIEKIKNIKLIGSEINRKIYGFSIPINGACRGTYKSKCLLIGDAGGFVNPLTGGGLRYGAVSAIEAAKTIELYKENKIDTFEYYKNKWENSIGKIFREAKLIRDNLYHSEPLHIIQDIKNGLDFRKKYFKYFL